MPTNSYNPSDNLIDLRKAVRQAVCGAKGKHKFSVTIEKDFVAKIYVKTQICIHCGKEINQEVSVLEFHQYLAENDRAFERFFIDHYQNKTSANFREQGHG